MLETAQAEPQKRRPAVVAVKSLGERLGILTKRIDRQDRTITDLQTALAAANHRLADLADNQQLLDTRLRAASTEHVAGLIDRP